MEPNQFRLVLALDNKETEKQVTQLLTKFYDVKTASDAEEVYHIVHHFHPDLAIMDYSLKNINPIELYEGIEFLHPETTYVLCAYHDNMEVAKRIWNKRAIDFIRKPIDTEHLLDDIYKITRHIIDVRKIETLEVKIKELEAEIRKLKGEVK